MMVRLLSALLLIAWFSSQPVPAAKDMFYDPGDLGLLPITEARPSLRPIRYTDAFLRCGIHYWLEAEDGTRVTERTAMGMPGRFTLHIRNNIGGGFLTVWDVTQERELTPRDDRVGGGGRWSGHLMSDAVYRVPGAFEFSKGESATHLVVVWARSQSEVAHSAERARARVKEMPAWMRIVREVDESTPGEVGTYVVNRRDGGLVAQIVFRAQ
jgi:hypothetical protein